MDLEKYNPWWSGRPDEKYEEWNAIKYKWVPKLLNKMHLEPFSLNFLIGPRQVGKTTAMKILINMQLNNKLDDNNNKDKNEINSNIYSNPYSIFYYQCDELINYEELGEVLDEYLKSRNLRGIKSSLIVLDEITFVDEWWRAIKSRIDSGEFKNDILIITGSASIELLKEKERFPGRRGNGKDYLMYPLSFSEYAHIRNIPVSSGNLNNIQNNMDKNIIFKNKLDSIFNEYLETGGFPKSIQDFLNYGYIRQETKKTYLDWIIGDVIKAKKNIRYAKEVFSYLLMTKLSPVGWTSISKNTSINSPHTAQSYIETFEDLLIIKVLELIDANNKIIFRKEKKIHFIDPFIYKILCEYTGKSVLNETLVESIVASHIMRLGDVYYWRNGTEVDVILFKDNEQIGFEVKWGPKRWRKLRHIKKVYLLNKEILPLFLASLSTS